MYFICKNYQEGGKLDKYQFLILKENPVQTNKNNILYTFK